MVAVNILEKRGYSVELANNGKEALDALEREAFDLVLMDLQMPGMGGLEATAIIRNNEKTTGEHLPILAMTAHAMRGDRERCLEAGMDSYISKPIHAEKLVNLIQELIMKHAPNPTDAAAPAASQAAETVDGKSPFDPQHLLTQVDNDTELLKEIVDLFVSDSEIRISDIRDSIARQDSEALHRAAHTLKGAVSNFGAEPVFAASLELETMGRNKDLSRAADVLPNLEQELKRLRQALSEFVDAQLPVGATNG